MNPRRLMSASLTTPSPAVRLATMGTVLFTLLCVGIATAAGGVNPDRGNTVIPIEGRRRNP